MKFIHVCRLVWYANGLKQLMRVMKLTIVLLTAFLIQVSATTHAQHITLKEKDIRLKEVFNQIRKQTGYDVLWQSGRLDDERKIDVYWEATPLDKALRITLSRLELAYTVSDKTIVIKPQSPKEIRTVTLDTAYIDIQGRVYDENSQPLPGATIQVSGVNRVTITDEQGAFQMKAIPDNAYLVVSFLGYENRRVDVNEPLERIQLVPAQQKIDEVNIQTGYQTIPKERATGAFSVVPKEALQGKLETSILDRIEGAVPGLFMSNGNVHIRGISTLYGDRAPLYVVDGFPYEGNINFINPEDVVNITVMKDAAAASIYGTRAANGVIAITTRMGSPGKLSVSYNSRLFISPLPDRSYLNLLSSREMVDLQEELFNLYHESRTDYMRRSAQPKALEALYQHENNEITDAELQATLNHLRGLDNTAQLESELLQNQLKQQHAFSVSGGNDINRFNLSVNYLGNRSYAIKGKNEDINVAFKDQVSIAKWLSAEVGAATNFSQSTAAPINALGYYRSIMPYEMLKDEQGNYLSWNYRKSAYEIERLKSLGLYDETYNPLNELDQIEGSGKSMYVRLQGGFNVRFMPGLNLDLKYQMERGNALGKTYYTKNAYQVKNMVNDATVIGADGIEENIPYGGQIYENRSDHRSYTARAQLNFDRFIASNHHLTALMGAERRQVAGSSTSTHRMGYDDNNLQYIPVNAVDLAEIKNTQSINGTYSYNEMQYNRFGANEDRYVSFYGNAGYTFDDKYNVTASARIDDSNLFGTDPRYRHLPLWSAGGSWHLSKESFMSEIKWIDRLTLRTTYGLNGNVAKTVGPYLQAETRYYAAAEAMATHILYPPNTSLRWERTAVWNVGLDFSFLSDRISGALDVYSRTSTDLLGERETDPTNAFTTALINYGSLYNKGIELGLHTLNIRNDVFRWSSRLNISYNKNKMTEISTQNETVYGYTSGGGIEKVGYPMSSIFNFRYAGLDPTNGTVLVYDKNGEVIKNYDETGKYISNMMDIDGLVYSGSLRPTYTVGFSNAFAYQHLTLNIFVIANGGHVMRDAVPSILNRNNISQNIDKRAMNFWRQPGDEKIPGTIPAPNMTGEGNAYFSMLWFAADVNTLKADYIKVRDISLSYDFAPQFFNTKAISSARLTLQVQNPFKWFRNDQGLDPEAYAAYSIYAQRTLPVTPVYMIGVDFTF